MTDAWSHTHATATRETGRQHARRPQAGVWRTEIGMSAFAETTRILYSSLTAGVHVRPGLSFGNARASSPALGLFHAVVTFPLPFVLSASGNVGSTNQPTEPPVSDLQQGTRQQAISMSQSQVAAWPVSAVTCSRTE